MAFTPITLPAYPDAPLAPGVPALNRSVSNILAAVQLAEAVTSTFGLIAPSWGIYDQSGIAALEPDSFIGIEFSKGYDVPTYKIEQGGFGSYNKVSNPYSARVTMAIGQTVELRSAFLQAVAAICASTDLFTIITPEISYPTANINDYEYRRRERNGATLLLVDLIITEIRISTSTTFSSTAQPNGASQVNGGTVQASAPAQSGAYFPVAT